MKKYSQTKALKIAGIELRTSNTEAFQTIPPFWGKFYGENTIEKISNKVSKDVYAVYTNFENEGVDNTGVYSLIIGCEVSDIDASDSLKSVVVAPQERIVFEVEAGHPEKVGEKWIEIWQRNDLNSTIVADYELYKETGKIEIHIGTKKSGDS